MEKYIAILKREYKNPQYLLILERILRQTNCFANEAEVQITLKEMTDLKENMTGTGIGLGGVGRAFEPFFKEVLEEKTKKPVNNFQQCTGMKIEFDQIKRIFTIKKV